MPKQAADDARALRDKAISLLARREHSYQELCLKLCQRGYSIADIEPVLDRLVQQDLLSEQRYAEMIVKTRAEKAYGPLYIQQFLKQKGVADAIIAKALAVSDQDWQYWIYVAWRKKFHEAVPEDDITRLKQQRYLLSRGFSFEQLQTGLEACYNQTLNSV